MVDYILLPFLSFSPCESYVNFIRDIYLIRLFLGESNTWSCIMISHINASSLIIFSVFFFYYIYIINRALICPFILINSCIKYAI
jgi:hypothetical protein